MFFIKYNFFNRKVKLIEMYYSFFFLFLRYLKKKERIYICFENVIFKSNDRFVIVF